MDGRMTDAELLTLADREVGFLEDENNHCAASIMRALIVVLRYKMRERASAGLGDEGPRHDG